MIPDCNSFCRPLLIKMCVNRSITCIRKSLASLTFQHGVCSEPWLMCGMTWDRTICSLYLWTMPCQQLQILVNHIMLFSTLKVIADATRLLSTCIALLTIILWKWPVSTSLSFKLGANFRSLVSSISATRISIYEGTRQCPFALLGVPFLWSFTCISFGGIVYSFR